MSKSAPRPDRDSSPEPKKSSGSRTPYPVERPGIGDQPGSEPDYVPGKPVEDLPKI